MRQTLSSFLFYTYKDTEEQALCSKPKVMQHTLSEGQTLELTRDYLTPKPLNYKAVMHHKTGVPEEDQMIAFGQRRQW